MSGSVMNCILAGGPQGKLRIIRKQGQRYCPDHIQYHDDPDTKDEKRFHCWATIGHNFKSNIEQIKW